MKAWTLKDFGLANLQMSDTQTPVPKTGELLIKVGAVSLNYRDKAIVEGFYEPHLVPENLIPVSDAAGVVVALGEGVTRFKLGDRVNSHLYSRWLDGEPAPDEPAHCFGSPLPGGLAEYMIIHEDSAVRAPSNMSDEQASTLPIAALTAWYSLVDYGQIKAGQTVLIQGTGGVSIFALQLAVAMGARAIVTSSSDVNLQRALSLGAESGINYTKTPDWHTEVLKMTGGKGVDLLLDVAGGQGINQSIAATKAAGRIAQIGFLTGQSTQLNLMPLIFRQTTIRGIAVAPRSSFDRMNAFLSEHAIAPVIEQVYSFEQAHQAFEHLSKGAFGKIVISIDN
ncbi:zinc-dependent alcohol dehydrogenase family protein [Pseudomonas asiatica]|uniref:zinc-dependent alcohol dehydrogenase family protein n=1 Tax=Pseudomonas asiatica TaxID=2219225 RepID=UPI0018AB7935|nr:NAD(P)-dependent alcohol dehydrogenase [Pseudomonas asiatica]MBF8789039.1 NAD(P)-dependent alcohol dehydrogenase [Pseudomonas asiatica]